MEGAVHGLESELALVARNGQIMELLHVLFSELIACHLDSGQVGSNLVRLEWKRGEHFVTERILALVIVAAPVLEE